MSCGMLCPCQCKYSLDTHGFKRDTISSEKAWLDFAVRSLSREVAGKGNGQETVWNVACKPSWWESRVNLPWKNPTTNPKDNKDVLLQKYKALEQHLRQENKFPSDLEEEAKLWAEGKYKELFLLCELSCLQKKISGVHLAVLEACSKADKMKAHINQDMLDHVQNCLRASLKATENFQRKEIPKQLKRSRSRNEGQENQEPVPLKKCRRIVKIENRFVPILPKFCQGTVTNTATECSVERTEVNVSSSNTNPEDILEYANRVLEKQHSLSSMGKLAVTNKCIKGRGTASTDQRICPETLVLNRNCNNELNFDGSSTSPSSLYTVVEAVDPSSNTDVPLDLLHTNKSETNPSTCFKNTDILYSNEIDFLSSPMSSPIIDSSSNFSSCLSSPYESLQNSFVMQENLALTDQNSDSDSLLPSLNNNDLIDKSCIIEVEELFKPEIVPDNYPNPLSASSETPSCTQISDRGYISADDHDFDIDEIIAYEDAGNSILDDKDLNNLEQFLFAKPDQQLDLGNQMHLLDPQNLQLIDSS